MKKNVSPYGSWTSPVSAKSIASGGLKLSEIRVDGDDIYWLECRPQESGRYVIVRCKKNGFISDVFPETFNARNSVHEYGGGTYAVKDETIYFTNWKDQRIYKISGNNLPIPITHEPLIPSGERYADLTISTDSNWIFCVRERHFKNREPDNELIAINTKGSNEVYVLSRGYDFYSSPRQNPLNSKICWLSWKHPNMPWDGSELWIGDFDETECKISNRKFITGGETTSIIQPEWSSDGTLVFITDESGWWNVSKYENKKIVPIVSEEIDHGGPSWQFGFRTYYLNHHGDLILPDSNEQSGRIRKFNLRGELQEEINIPHTSISDLTIFRSEVLFIGASPLSVSEIIMMSLHNGERKSLKISGEIKISSDYISLPKKITFPTTKSGYAYGFYYPPTNPEFSGMESETPPLLVISHGGPTGSASTELNLSIQFWTTRGFAVVDVNYRGSSGYGKDFRDSLKGNWGIYDTDDCIAAVDYLIDKSLIDSNRIAIKGGSAGGYTTINALTFHDRFSVGATYYGISDLSVFVGDTHKFESRYLDSLIGPYIEKKHEYFNRSAINFTEKLSCPMIIFQGLEDKIVPPSQAKIMAEALREKKIPFCLMMFQGEQHGFRQSKNIVASLEAELYFYGKIMNFIPADKINPIVIENQFNI